jgi:hypothetical protein
VPGVDVHHRERHPAGRERLLRQPQHDDRVFAAAEQQHRPFELGHHLAHDEYALGFEGVEMAHAVSAAGHFRPFGGTRWASH